LTNTIAPVESPAFARTAVSATDKIEINEALTVSLPGRVREYLFESSGEVRQRPFDLTLLRIVLAKLIDNLRAGFMGVFQQGWPTEEGRVVQSEVLRDSIIGRLKLRLDGAIDLMNRLDRIRRVQGTLDPDQDALRNRCDRSV